MSVTGSLYSYFIYPLLLKLFPKQELNLVANELLPHISVIIAARNEAKRIATKLQGTLALDYPSDRLEVIVASDASDDATDSIVQSFAQRGVKLARTSTRGGKEAAQAHAISMARGEVLVFTDAATRLSPDSLKLIVEDFRDPSIGAVSSEDRIEQAPGDGQGSGEGAYVRYEMWLRRLESDRAGLVGLSGSLFAVRRPVADLWPSDVPSDITAALSSARLKLRAISNPQLIGYYADLQNPEKEYERKVRTVVRGMAAVGARAELLNPFRYGLFAFQLWGHKVMRWLTPVFMITLLASNIALAPGSGFYSFLLILQCAFYLVAVCAWRFAPLRGITFFRLCAYLLQVHWALLHAGFRFLRGERIVVWNPSVR